MISDELRKALLRNRVLALYGEINPQSTEQFKSDLLQLSLESDSPIKLLIDSQGGHVNEGFSIYDAIQMCNAPIYGIVNGKCMSMAVIVLLGCTKRFATPHSWFLIHAIASSKSYTFDDTFSKSIQDTERLLKAFQAQMRDTIASRTKLPPEEAEKLLKEGEIAGGRLNAEEALKFGLIDRILSPDESKLFKYEKKDITSVSVMPFEF